MAQPAARDGQTSDGRTSDGRTSDGPTFRILVVRSGGIAGIRQQWQVEPQDDADVWVALVQACPWGVIGSDPDSRDRFSWRIEARMPRPVRTATVPDALLVGPWRTLVDRVREVGSHG